MKTAQHFGLYYIMMAIAQVIISNCFQVTEYITLSFLPAMVLCIPLNVGTVAAMFMAFATGLAVDALSEGLLGLNALALVPVALIRVPLLRIVFGEELTDRKDSFTFRKYGMAKISVAVLVAQVIFLTVYIIADGAGTRPFWFNAARGAASLASGYVISMIVTSVLTPDER